MAGAAHWQRAAKEGAAGMRGRRNLSAEQQGSNVESFCNIWRWLSTLTALLPPSPTDTHTKPPRNAHTASAVPYLSRDDHATRRSTMARVN